MRAISTAPAGATCEPSVRFERSRAVPRSARRRGVAPIPTSGQDLRHLQVLTDAALEHLELDELLARLLDGLCRVLRADAATILLVDDEAPDELVVRASRGLEDEVTAGVRIRVGRGIVGRIAEGRRAVKVDELDPPAALTPALRSGGVASLLGTPLLTGDDCIGVLHVSSSRPRHFTACEARLLELTAERAVIAIDHARRFEAERRARAEAEAARHRLAILARVSDAVSASLDLEKAVAALAHTTVEVLADGCAIDVVEGEQLRPVAVRHRSPERERLFREKWREQRFRSSCFFPPAVAVRTGQLVRSAVDAASTPGEPPAATLLRRLGIRSVVAVPLEDGGRILGVLSVCHRAGSTHSDVELVEEVARRATRAIANARRFAAGAEAVHALERTLQPPSLPSIPGLEVATAYLPGDRHNDVGGDFFDVFPLERRSWGVVVGDVCGKGHQAAATAALARHTVRAASMCETGAAGVLRVLNDALAAERDEWLFCTAAYLRLRRAGPCFRSLLALGGHPHPFLWRNGVWRKFGTAGTALGVLPTAELSDCALELAPGEKLVLYTDGLIEARLPSGEIGSEVERTLDELGDATAMETVSALLSPLRENGDRQRDDVTLVVLRVNETIR